MERVVVVQVQPVHQAVGTKHEMMHFMDEHDLRTALVTASEGTLVGLVRRTDLECPTPGERAVPTR